MKMKKKKAKTEKKENDKEEEENKEEERLQFPAHEEVTSGFYHSSRNTVFIDTSHNIWLLCRFSTFIYTFV